MQEPASFSSVIDVEQEDIFESIPTIGWNLPDSVSVSYGGISVSSPNPGPLSVSTTEIGGSHLIELTARELWTDSFFEASIFEVRGFDVLPSDGIPIDFDVLDFTVARTIGYGDGTIAFSALIHSYSDESVPAPGAAVPLLLGACFRTGRRTRA